MMKGIYMKSLLILFCTSLLFASSDSINVKFYGKVLQKPTKEASLVVVLDDGCSVKIVQEQGDWLEVQSGGYRGWIEKGHTNYISSEHSQNIELSTSQSSSSPLSILVPLTTLLAVILLRIIQQRRSKNIAPKSESISKGQDIIRSPLKSSNRDTSEEPNILQGIITEDGIFEILQLIELGGKSGTLSIYNNLNNLVGEIGFINGIIVSARNKQGEGEEVAMNIVMIKEGEFVFTDKSVISSNCSIQPTTLILNAVHCMDEQKSKQSHDIFSFTHQEKEITRAY